jgi:hypothetical protein
MCDLESLLSSVSTSGVAGWELEGMLMGSEGFILVQKIARLVIPDGATVS